MLFAAIAPPTPAPGMTGLMQQIPLCLTAAVPPIWTAPRNLGLDAYIDELRAKRAILDKLLVNYNDGRRKTFYCAAVYLLPLEDLKNIVAKLEDQPECSVKERATAAVKLLQGAADGHGVCLKLKKKKG